MNSGFFASIDRERSRLNHVIDFGVRIVGNFRNEESTVSK